MASETSDSNTKLSLTDNGSSVLVPSMVSNQPQRAPHKRHDALHLPSNKFRHSVWHDLRANDIKGNELNCPRVRKCPEKKEKVLYTVRDEEGSKIHHSRKGRDKIDYMNNFESWENCTELNLSYQDLGHRFQKENLVRILKKLIRVERLNLADNSLINIHAVSFPRLTHLTLCMNYIDHFKKLPKFPELLELNLADNHIDTLDGLSVLNKRVPLESLDLRRNPVVFTTNYRYRVFQTLPYLHELDGIPKLASDDHEEQYDDNEASRCVIL
ncbi:uncharacterized protein LOC144451150 [Glandiceps talaboti]